MTTSRSRAQNMCRILYDAKIAGIGYTTSTAVQEILAQSRGMQQTFATTEKERASNEGM